ncbi:hypothetical protein [Crinalium epipsammum]|uniref:hypothetical protein n=1 Tax=Crinalium epipsammum TaxID=241425 RepID=UPI0012FA6499|nr:hypothetical protein [Crinalium epipsammum]
MSDITLPQNPVSDSSHHQLSTVWWESSRRLKDRTLHITIFGNAIARGEERGDRR